VTVGGGEVGGYFGGERDGWVVEENWRRMRLVEEKTIA
jgi:hypothetical protein